MNKGILKVITIFVTIPIIASRRIVKNRLPPDPRLLHLYGPKGVEEHEMTTCEEWTRSSRFNPYSVLDTKWFMFYSWAPEPNAFVMSFFAPTRKEIKYLQNLMDTQVKDPIDWSARILVMQDHTEKRAHLLVEQGDRGQYLIYMIVRLPGGDKLDPMDIRLKQTADNRYLGLMKCEEDIVFVFSRDNDIPKKAKLQDAAATVRYRARGGRSYLYQGHQWMPIPESSEEHYWTPRTTYNWYALEYLYD